MTYFPIGVAHGFGNTLSPYLLGFYVLIGLSWLTVYWFWLREKN